MAKDYNPSQRNREAFEALTDTAGNVPPQAVELEEAVLGALMLEKDSIIAVQEYVTPDAFYTEEHRTIYRAIEELSMELKPIDLYTVTERLKAKKELKKVGGASYLAQLTQKVGSAANVEFRQDHRPEVRAARADPLGDRDSEAVVRRIDRRDGADRICRG